MTFVRRIVPVLAAGALAGVSLLATPLTASADAGRHRPTVKVLDRTVGAPFQLAFRRGLLVADGATSTVSRLGRHGLTPLAHGPTPGEVAGVAVNRHGDLAYTTTNYATGDTTLTVRLGRGGTVVADLSGHERTKNPDAGIRYGIDHPTPCQVKAFEPLGGATYTGQVDSHPYAVTDHGDDWVVADAGGNDLLRVDRRGRVATLKVLPRQPTTITAEAAAGLGLPDCVVGAVYNFEPVPTDVEVGRKGRLYTSLLPGGPEDASLGARGSVYAVDPYRGRADRVAGGFLGATNLALADDGRIFVAELFAGRVSVVEHGRVRPYVPLTSALSLVWNRDVLYAGTLGETDQDGNPTGPGSLVAITERH
jgi:hypothetical protein